MIKMEIDHWKLVELKDKFPEAFAALRAADPTIPPPQELKDKWMNYSCYVQDPGELPQEILDRATWKAVQPLKVLFDKDKEGPGKGIKEALASYQVHLPGNELLGIQSVEVREDCCTEDLQRELDRGWRIIAVCPRGGQRRPDYVLGRFTRLG